jgi:hypothetical protein
VRYQLEEDDEYFGEKVLSFDWFVLLKDVSWWVYPSLIAPNPAKPSMKKPPEGGL